MKKIIALSLVISCVLGVLTACDTANIKTSKSYTFEVETGDNIKVSLDTSDDYNISSDLPFVISCDDEKLSQGTFIFAEYYQDYIEVVEDDDKAEIIDTGKKNGNEYIFWCFDNKEWNYAILIADSNTAIILGNTVSQKTAERCFKRLTISVDD